MPDLRYPIGPFQPEVRISGAAHRELLWQIAQAPKLLRAAVDGLSAEQLDTPYRLEGWTVRQVVHHLADAHMNWYVRTKLALTEIKPTIKPYAEARWAELHDARHGRIEPSLLLLDGLHERWVQLFESLAPVDWSRDFIHPERGVLTLDATLPMHAWHGRHHTAHITELRKRMGWV
jgi:uncharacterized damage-inducible protein DinB